MFSELAFSTQAFSTDAFLFAIEEQVQEILSGGYGQALLGGRKRTQKEIRKAREDVGLIIEIIQDIAEKQCNNLVVDEQKQIDEFANELKLQGIQFEVRFLELLNDHRQAVMNAEIGRLLKDKLLMEEKEILLLLAAIFSY